MRMLPALRLSRAPVLAFAAMGMGWGTFAAFVPELKAGIGASDGVFGVALLGSPVGLLMAVWLAPWMDGRAGRLALPLASGALGLSFVPVALVAGAEGPVWAFALAMGGVGLASGTTDVLMNSRVSELEAGRGVSVMNLNHGMFSVAYMIAALAAGAAREAALPATAMFALWAAVGLVAMRWMRQPVLPVEVETVPGSFPRRVVLWGGVLVLIAFLTEGTVETWSALHLERTLGGGAAEGAAGPAMLGLTMAIGRLSGQAVAGRVPEATVLRWGALLAAVGAVGAAAAPTLWVGYVSFAAMGLGISVLAPMALALVGRRVEPRHRTRAIARVAVIGFLGFFVAPSLMGGLSELFGLRLAYLAIGLVLLAVLPVLMALRRVPRQDAGTSQTAP